MVVSVWFSLGMGNASPIKNIYGYIPQTLDCTWSMSLPNPCTRCATELDSFQGYWRNRGFSITIIIK